MDSASSPLPYASRDGAAADDDAALLVAAGQAKEAALLFQVGKFVDCLRILNQLLQKNDDPRVRHNIAIAENIQNGCLDPKKLIETLEIIKRRIEELAHASGEHIDVTSNDGRKHLAETNSTEHHISGSSSIYSGEYDTSVVMFNTAVVWFHFHKYENSFLYLDTLYQNIEPIDEGTAFRVCLLLLDVALLSNHASRSADVLSYMEKAFCASSSTNQIDNGTQPQSLLLPKSAPLSSNSAITDSSHADSLETANTLDNSLSEEELNELQLLSSLDISGQNLRRSFDAASSNDIPRSQVEEPLSVIDLRLKLHLYKVRFSLLTRNLKAAKREVKMAMNLARGKEYSMALYLKSQLEYTRRNYLKAIKLLMASSNLKETGIDIMYFNNLGCIYYQLGKHHSSGVFFSKALKNSSFERKEKPPKLVPMPQDKSLLVSYNCGMHFLACGRPYHAAQCFRKASLIFHNRPLLWLRFAECCLMAQEKGLIKSNSSEKHEVRVDVIGRGKWRQLALRNGTSTNGQWENVQKDNLFPGDGKQLDLSMALARQCLVNALHLLDSFEARHSRSGSPQPVTEKTESRETVLSKRTGHKTAMLSDDPKDPNVARASIQSNSNGEVKEQKGGNSLSASLQNSIADYKSILANEIQMMKQATLADLAYVELALGNPLKALPTAKSLLKLPECSRICTFLGTMYIAEALCLLNKPKEAAEHLMTYVSRGNNVDLPYSKEDCENWKVEKVVDNEDAGAGTIAGESRVSTFSSPEVARGIFCANYAANFAVLGDLDQADHFLRKALTDIPNSPQAIITAIYLDLKRGKLQEAVAKLKQHSAIRFLPGSDNLKGSF